MKSRRLLPYIVITALILSLAAAGCGGGSSGSVRPAVCGNGDIETGEQCDDGNATSGDGCSSTCQIESSMIAGKTSFVSCNQLYGPNVPNEITRINELNKPAGLYKNVQMTATTTIEVTTGAKNTVR